MMAGLTDFVNRMLDEALDKQAERRAEQAKNEPVDGTYVQLDDEVDTDNIVADVEAEEVPVTEDAQEESVTEEVQEDSVTKEEPEEFVEEEVQEEPVAENAQEEPVAENAQEEPVVENAQEEPVAEEKQEETAAQQGRMDMVSGHLKFPADFSEDQKQDIQHLMAMPERNLDEVSAKAWNLSQWHRGVPLSQDEAIAVTHGMSHMTLQMFHESYDVDGGVAWKENEKQHPLEGWSDIAEHPEHAEEIHTVDMKKFGYQDGMQASGDVQEESSIPEVKSYPVLWKEDDTGYSENYQGTREMRDDGMVEYDGVLGTFVFDPTQFELQMVRVEADDFGHDAGMYPILKYVGDEVDGRHIQIPEGLKSGAMMFADNKELQTMPKLPASLEDGFSMFKGCENLQLASCVSLPSKMEDAAFMFADCPNLMRGPMRMPGSLRDATGMFANCESLQNTPHLNSGLESADSMFWNCKGLKKKPNIPRSCEHADFATEGCTGIDAAEKARAEKEQSRQQRKLEKQMNKKTAAGRLAYLFSACMQVHACCASGMNVFAAMYRTHKMRQSGAWGRDMVGGWKAHLRAGNGPNSYGFSNLMYDRAVANAAKRKEMDERRGAKDMEALKETQFGDTTSSKQDRRQFANGKRAMEAGYFEKVSLSGYPGYKTNQDFLRKDLSDLQSKLRVREDLGTLNARDKTYYAKKLQEMVSNQAAYYKGAELACEKKASGKDGKSFDKQSAMRGLGIVTESNMEILASRIQEMQTDHQVLNQRQLDAVCKMMESTSYGKTKGYQSFKESMSAMIDSQSKAHERSEQDVMREHMERRKDRGAQAEAKFGFSGDETEYKNPDLSFGG